MITLFPVRSVSHAVHYYEQSDHSDYYTRGERCPSVWAGRGARILNVENLAVDKKRFARYLEGRIGGQILGNGNHSGNQRHPATDATASAPKSVSLVALVGGDKRVIEAHDSAVASTIRRMESEAAYTRRHYIGESGENKVEHVYTGNLLCAVFRHDSSRSLDPQLHSHIVVVNATQLDTGEWRSIESRHLYCLQKRLGLTYRQELASNLRELGYEIRRTSDASFEIDGVPDEVISAFSSRREAINTELESIGYSRETASSKLKDYVSRKLRSNKKLVQFPDLLERWRAIDSQHGFDSRNIVRNAIRRANDPKYPFRVRRHCERELEVIGAECLSSLSERDSVFSRKALLEGINAIAVGYGISSLQVAGWIRNAETEGRILTRTIREYSTQFSAWQEVSAYTTPGHYATEKSLMASVSRQTNSVKPVATLREIEHLSFQTFNSVNDAELVSWNPSQITALRGLLLTTSSAVALQGFAGTAKTTTVLRGYAEFCRNAGYNVIGMAPTASACRSLKDGAALTSVVTVASHLVQQSYNTVSERQQIWIVDEASLLSSRELQKLLIVAERDNARVVLVGDARQLGSIEAGAAFRQLQEFGIETFQLDQILRQKNSEALSAVYASIDGEIATALKLLQGHGGDVVEVSGDVAARHQAIVDSWISLSHRDRINSLIVDPSREGRMALTIKIRKALKLEEKISSHCVDVPQLERVDHTSGSKCDVFNYKVGDFIRFGKAYKVQKVAKNSYWRITEIDSRKNILTIRDCDNREVIWNPRSQWGVASQTYRSVRAELALNDRLVWTHNDRALGLTNGLRGIVCSIDKS